MGVQIERKSDREQTLTQLLTEMDGFTRSDGVILIASTNRADLLDPALLRPGRFDKKIKISKPGIEGREAVLKVHSQKTKLSSSINLGQIARDTTDFSPAELSNVFNEASLEAIRISNEIIKRR